MKNYIFLVGLILMSNIYMINSKTLDLRLPTNYTLNTLKSIESSKAMECPSKCPSDFKCQEYKHKDYYCGLGDFLCIDDENFHCIQTHTDIYELRYYSYNIRYERYEKGENDKIRPIIEICSKKSVDDNSCNINEKCENNSDCLSGNCYKNYCISEKPVYLCGDYIKDDKYSMKCGKHYGMECEKDSDCFSNDCGDDGFCRTEYNDDPEIDRRYPSGADIEKSINRSLMYGGLILLGIVILINILCCWCFHHIKKNKN